MTILVLNRYYEFGSIGRPDVLPSVLGWNATFDVEGHKMTVSFPGMDDSLTIHTDDDLGPQPGVTPLIIRNDEPQLFALNYFKVATEFEVQVSDEALGGNRDAHDRPALQDALEQASRLSRETASRVRRWVFAAQPDLGPSEESPPDLLTERLYEKGSGTPVRISLIVSLYGSFPSDEKGIGRDFFNQLGESLSRLEDPAAPDTLLAQAQNMLMHGQGRALQPQVAVLLAAVAAEVKAKRLWETIVPEGSRSILDLALKNPQAFPQSAHELFRKIPFAIVGRSLADDDKETYKRIYRLFELRNQVAHSAADLEEAEARSVVLAVPIAFNWLNSMVAKE